MNIKSEVKVYKNLYRNSKYKRRLTKIEIMKGADKKCLGKVNHRQ